MFFRIVSLLFTAKILSYFKTSKYQLKKGTDNFKCPS